MLFLKSFVITSCFVLMAVALFSGLITADERISRTMGTEPPEAVVYSSDTQTLSLRLFGKSFSADLTPAIQAADFAKSLKPLVAPEIRLVSEAIGDLSDFFAEVFE